MSLLKYSPTTSAAQPFHHTQIHGKCCQRHPALPRMDGHRHNCSISPTAGLDSPASADYSSSGGFTAILETTMAHGGPPWRQPSSQNDVISELRLLVHLELCWSFPSHPKGHLWDGHPGHTVGSGSWRAAWPHLAALHKNMHLSAFKGSSPSSSISHTHGDTACNIRCVIKPQTDGAPSYRGRDWHRVVQQMLDKVSGPNKPSRTVSQNSEKWSFGSIIHISIPEED